MATQRTRVYIEGVALDLDKNVDIDFTYSIADISDFEKRTTTFSKTIVLPGTAHNSFLLGNYFDFNINNDYSNVLDNVGVNFNPLKKAFAKVTLDNVEVFVGVLRLLEITSKNGEIQYQCALFGSLGGLFTALGETLLTDLNLDDLDHRYDIATITNSWDTTDLVADGFVYPLANYGFVNAFETEYDVKNLRPAVSVKRLFDEIISQAGYTYSGDFWNNNNLDKLILQNGEEKFSAFYDSLAVASTDGFNFVAITENGLDIVAVAGEADKIVNVNGDTLNVKINFNLNASNGLNFGCSAELQVAHYSGTDVLKSVQNTTIGYGYNGVPYDVNAQFDRNMILENGDYFKIGLLINNPFSGFPGSDPGYFTLYPLTSIVTVSAVSASSKIPAIYDSNILGRSIVPEGIKQSDFIKSIINLFNLYIIQDPDNEFDLTFIPYNEFYINETIDWTDKKDLAKGFSVKGSNEFIPKSYSFRYKDDVDFYSKTYKNKYVAGYGNLKYETENEFSKEDTALELVFSLAPLAFLKSFRLMAQLYDINTDGTFKQVKCNPKLSFWGGKKSTSNSYSILNGEDILESGLFDYGYAGHIYNPASIGSGSLDDLVFSIPREIYFGIANYPTVNVYNLFYKQFIDSQNNKDTKLITLYLLLNAVDIMNLSFRKYYRMDNGLYYLNKIDGYNPLSNDLTKVELLRLVAIEELDVFVEYTPVPVEDFLSFPKVVLDKALPFNKSFDVQWAFVDSTDTLTTGEQTITIGAGQLFGNGTPIAAGGTDGFFNFIRILPPAEDSGYIYNYTGDYSTL